jgi:DNA topoisomerase-2
LLDELQKQLDRLSNQARFIQMIIDGKLVVSKKKKAVLIAELRKLNFTPFPKVSQAKKAGEDEEAVEEEASEDADEEIGSADYDYLLGMPIWSLTQERVERIKKQIGDKELEIDVIIKLSPKDLWNQDLDDFVEAWETSIAEDAQRKKKLRNGGRRASAKLGTAGGKAKKKKARAGSDDDSDYEGGKKKSTALKAIQDRAKNKGKGSLWGNFLADGPPKAVEEKPKVVELLDNDSFMDIDQVDTRLGADKDHDSELVVVKKKTSAAAAKPKAKEVPRKAIQLDSDSGDDPFLDVAEEPVKKQVHAPTRAARTTKPKKYVVDDDSDGSSFNDDNLGDITEMVKPLAQSTAAAGRALFTAPMRPGSSHGLTSQKTANIKAKSKSPVDSDNGVDDTDFNALLQGSPRRALARPGDSNMGLSDDDDDTMGVPIRKASAPKPKAAITKAAPASKLVAKKLPAKKAAAAAAAPKPMPLSPAAKAYKLKQDKAAARSKPAPKKKAVLSDDDDDDLANDILVSDEEMDDAPVARPSRRAAATKTKYTAGSDSDEDEESEDDYDVDDGSD